MGELWQGAVRHPQMPEYPSAVPDDAPWTTVLDLTQLRIEVRRGSGQPLVDPHPWFEVRLHALGAPFRGTIESAWFPADLEALRAALTGITAAVEEELRWRPGDDLPEDDDAPVFTVGGDRAAELRLSGGLASSGDTVWLTAWMTPSGDDPYPKLETLSFEKAGDLLARLDALDAVLAPR